MPGVIESIGIASGLFFAWPVVLFVAIGAMSGIVFGALPGLGGPVLLSLLIPITYGMNPDLAIVFLGASLGGVAFGGSISAILINTPGTPPNAATTFDGYPMSQQGRAGEALGVSATASALGAIFGVVVLVALIPVAQLIILAFSPPEFFWIAVLGLVVIALVSRGNLLKGLVSGGFGLMVTFIGFSGITGTYRFGFGTEYLFGGIEFVPALIGLFAISEVINLHRKGGTIASENPTVTGGVLRGVRQVFAHPVVFVRSAVIGTLIGMIPGAGGTVANFLSYIQTVQSAPDADRFGQGDPRGVIASEAANDAKDGGSLLPAVAFGIPGSASTAVLLAGLIIHGLNPGQQMLSDGLPLLMLLLFALVGSNLLTSALGLGLADQFARLTRVPVERIIPAVLAISLVGAYALRLNYGDVLLTLLFGVIGYAMIVFDYSRVAVVIAMVLGPIAEAAYIQSLQISDSGHLIFITRPISAALIVLTLIVLLLPIVRDRQAGKGENDVG